MSSSITSTPALQRNVPLAPHTTLRIGGPAAYFAEPESEELRILLFEAVRELLFNVAKHAETPRAQLSTAATRDGEVCLVVSDEGEGFTPADPRLEKASAGGFGLFSIRERLELMGGRLQVDAAPGRGTRVTISASSTGQLP